MIDEHDATCHRSEKRRWIGYISIVIIVDVFWSRLVTYFCEKCCKSHIFEILKIIFFSICLTLNNISIFLVTNFLLSMLPQFLGKMEIVYILSIKQALNAEASYIFTLSCKQNLSFYDTYLIQNKMNGTKYQYLIGIKFQILIGHPIVFIKWKW